MATELTERPATRPLLETWGKNERMRHLPPVEWMIEKLDGELRRRIDILCVPGVPASNEMVESELRALCRSIDRLADAGKHSRPANHAPAELGARVEFALTHAVSSLRSLDASLFGRRYPFQTFERSKAELIWGALLVVIDHVHRLTLMISAVDPRVDERLLEGLVTLQEPLQEKAMA